LAWLGGFDERAHKWEISAAALPLAIAYIVSGLIVSRYIDFFFSSFFYFEILDLRRTIILAGLKK